MFLFIQHCNAIYMQIVQLMKHISYKRLYAVKKQIVCLYIATKRLLLLLLICYLNICDLSIYTATTTYTYLLTHLFYLRFTCKFYSTYFFPFFYFIYQLTYFCEVSLRAKIIQKILLPLLMLPNHNTNIWWEFQCCLSV